MNYSCYDCKYFCNNPAEIEMSFPGLNSLSSAYASVRGEAGICSRRELFLLPVKKCGYFEPLLSVSGKVQGHLN